MSARAGLPGVGVGVGAGAVSTLAPSPLLQRLTMLRVYALCIRLD